MNLSEIEEWPCEADGPIEIIEGLVCDNCGGKGRRFGGHYHDGELVYVGVWWDWPVAVWGLCIRNGVGKCPSCKVGNMLLILAPRKDGEEWPTEPSQPIPETMRPGNIWFPPAHKTGAVFHAGS